MVELKVEDFYTLDSAFDRIKELVESNGHLGTVSFYFKSGPPQPNIYVTFYEKEN